MLKSAVHMAGRAYVRAVTRSEADGQRFRKHNERPIEFGFVMAALARLRPRTVLDVGSGTTALPSIMASCGCVVTATDNIEDYWPNGMVNRHWHIRHDDILKSSITETFDLVTCVSVLEHITDARQAVSGLIERVTTGKHLVITTPYNERRGVPNVYELPDAAYGKTASFICRSHCRADLDAWLSMGLTLVEQQHWRVFSGDVWAQGEMLPEFEQTAAEREHQLTCLLLRKD